jgi:uncharacterized protein YkwD
VTTKLSRLVWVPVLACASACVPPSRVAAPAPAPLPPAQARFTPRPAPPLATAVPPRATTPPSIFPPGFGFPPLVLPPLPPFPPAPAPASTPAPSEVSADEARREAEMLVAVNAVRASGATCGGAWMAPVGPLVVNTALARAARAHSRDMASRDYFSHTSLDGRSVGDRLHAQGKDTGSWGENIAAGGATVSDTMKQWMDSPGHCRNVMSPDYSQIGVGHGYAAQSSMGHYWTQDFAG